jgi:hypothetical protein
MLDPSLVSGKRQINQMDCDCFLATIRLINLWLVDIYS